MASPTTEGNHPLVKEPKEILTETAVSMIENLTQNAPIKSLVKVSTLKSQMIAVQDLITNPLHLRHLFQKRMIVLLIEMIVRLEKTIDPLRKMTAPLKEKMALKVNTNLIKSQNIKKTIGLKKQITSR